MVEEYARSTIITLEFEGQLAEMYNTMIKETFYQLIKKYDTGEARISELWLEIEKAYSSSNRFYHTLAHLTALLNQLTEIQTEISNWEAVLFSLYYHDIVYDATQSDNEEQSAMVAAERMRCIKVPEPIIEVCEQHILATKWHKPSANMDSNYFTDADLSILGYSFEAYSMYAKSVRMEYLIYSDRIFNEGRSKVLKHFLRMERIFKTDFFYSRFEQQAKCNLAKELDTLNGFLNE